MAPGAVVVPVRYAGDVTTAPLDRIARAIRDRADRVPGGVMNLSFAVSGTDSRIAAAIEYAASRDVVVVAAAGNENETAPGRTWWPAAYPSVLAVASLDENGQPAKESSRGGRPDDIAGAGVVDPLRALTAVDVATPPTEPAPDRGERIALAPLAGSADLLGRTGRLAAGSAGIVVLLAAIVMLGGAARRRIAALRGDPAAVERVADVHLPLQPVPGHRPDGG